MIPPNERLVSVHAGFARGMPPSAAGCAPHCVLASFISLVSAWGAGRKLSHCAARPFPTGPAALGSRGNPVRKENVPRPVEKKRFSFCFWVPASSGRYRSSAQSKKALRLTNFVPAHYRQCLRKVQLCPNCVPINGGPSRPALHRRGRLFPLPVCGSKGVIRV